MTANGDMLRLARQRRGFQQNDAAKRIGVDQSLLSRFENKLVEIRQEIVNRAALVYQLPENFFYQLDPVYGAPVSVHPMWRKKADVSARELDSVISELNIRIIHLRRLLEGAHVANTSDLPRMELDEYGTPDKIAALLRAHWRVPSGPLRNLTLLIEKAGVIVAHSALGRASISGVTFAVPGLPPLIVLNSDQPADRMRFSLAHELAHLVMHRFPTANMEKEANEFAVALLMPSADIRPFFRGKRIDLAALASLKPEWQVSMAALLMRARGLDFVTDSQYTFLWKQISARGYRLREPPALDFPAERPGLLQQLMDLHLSALRYTPADLAKMLCISETDLRELYKIGVPDDRTKPKLTVLK